MIVDLRAKGDSRVDTFEERKMAHTIDATTPKIGAALDKKN